MLSWPTVSAARDEEEGREVHTVHDGVGETDDDETDEVDEAEGIEEGVAQQLQCHETCTRAIMTVHSTVNSATSHHAIKQ